MTNELIYNRYEWVDIASIAYQADHSDYSGHVSELVVFKRESDGLFAYAQTGHCSCCGADYRGLTLTALELGEFILTARKWAREVPTDTDVEYLIKRVKRVIDLMIDYVDGDRESKIEVARQKTQQARETMAELDKIRRAFNKAVDAKMTAASAHLNAMYEELNKLTDC